MTRGIVVLSLRFGVRFMPAATALNSGYEHVKRSIFVVVELFCDMLQGYSKKTVEL